MFIIVTEFRHQEDCSTEPEYFGPFNTKEDAETWALDNNLKDEAGYFSHTMEPIYRSLK